MEKYLVLDDEGAVVNVVLWDPELPKTNGWVPQPDETVTFGWKQQKDGSFLEPEEAEKRESPGDKLRAALRALLEQAEAEGVKPSALLD
jgi:hypothetical protein